MTRRSKLKIRPAVSRPAAPGGSKNVQTKPNTTTTSKSNTATQGSTGAAENLTPTTGSVNTQAEESVQEAVSIQSCEPAVGIQKPVLQPEITTAQEIVVCTVQGTEDVSSGSSGFQQAPGTIANIPLAAGNTGNCAKENDRTQTKENTDSQELIHISNTDDKSSTSTKSVAKSRRRKLVACPQMARKRLKVAHTDLPKVQEERQARPNEDKTMQPVSVTSPELHLTLPPPHVVEEVKYTEQIKGSDEEIVSDKELTTLTTVTSLRCSTDDCETRVSVDPTQSSTAQLSVTESTVEQNKPKGKVLDTGVEPWSPTVEQNKPKGKVLDTKLVPWSPPEAPVSKQPPNPRAKTTTEIHRDKAVKKMKKVLETQEGDVKVWPEMDHNVFSMSDLIYLNPPKSESLMLGMNSQKQDSDEVVVSHPDQPAVQKTVEMSGENEGNSVAEENEEDTALPVPQIRIAEDGSVVVDEESIVVDTEKAPDPKIKTVYEFGRDNTINQCSFRRRAIPKPARWTEAETNKFYKCLCIVGAEFSLMAYMFGERSADDLRRKFRRERKKNPARVDKALMQQHLSKWTDDMFETRTEEAEPPKEKEAVT